MANTSLTDAAALASHPLPHSNAPLSACSTLNAPATTLPLFPSTTFAVMCFPDTNTLKAYLIIIPIPPSPTHGLTQYNLGHSGPRPNTNYKIEQNPIFYYQYQTTNMALAMGIMASTTITLIRPPLTFLSCRSNNNNSSSSVSAASRIFHFRSISAMSTPQGSSDSASTKTGVFYRNWTIENATQLGLKGWVRNRRDGSVEALFSGSVDAVQEMEQRCRRGPPDAVVTGLQVFPSDDDPATTGFHRKPTL
ncbi:uncharacterized protein LOC114382805 isoform X2 [Glycine soja]|uniref:acylphosphatase n=1 Tax=Glycine soja TaxID=3848 RepID=A0A445HFQ1_GLYSO|nr:uncharacterized protein LOC114382805 isoform X2 [Glycine soja]RZB72524.1 Acylphosphatase isoform B [Glycine soja]